MLEDGTLANIQLKGASVAEWSDFFRKSKSRLADEWIVVKSAKAGKKGAVKFFTPEFSFERSLTEDEATQADDAFDVLDEYLQSYLKKPVINNIEVNDPVVVDDDDLEF
jgi:hypothetical protein